MPIAPGTRFGPYEIISRIGAGGMGEVFRARDTRLGRAVAIKVLPGEFAGDAARLQRFEQEARAASALNHPNIITVYDVGSVDHISYLAMELVEGKSLRELVDHGALPVRRLLDHGVQIADGLAKAHDAGIIHRDLKPENIMISADGFVKILDFGLAKLTPLSGDESKTAVKRDSTGGTLLGTAGYMSPEQAAGEKVDFRSDQFSLGTILYEMASGANPFRRDTAAETLTAIIREEPQRLDPSVPAPLRWLIERCLAKDPDARYASTKDLARDLKSVRDHLSDVNVEPALKAAPHRLRVGATLLLLLVAVVVAFTVGRQTKKITPPEFKQLTFRRGTIWNARFAPDGRVIYSAAWDGAPSTIFQESRSLGLADADILAISRSGQMLLSLHRHNTGPFQRAGTLAQMAVDGSTAPRELTNDVREADWTPDEKEMMVVRDVGGHSRIELPIGHVLYETAGWVSNARVSRDGSRVAFLDHAILNDDGGSVAVVDRSGKKTILSGTFQTLGGLVWSPRDEVWFSGSKEGSNRALFAVDAVGDERLLTRAGGSLTIQDITPDGRAIVTQDVYRIRLFTSRNGEKERELSWLDWSLAGDLTKDGKEVVFSEAGEGGGAGYSVFIRDTDGSPAIRLGEGIGLAFSPDRQWVVAIVHSGSFGELMVFPTGAGMARRISTPGLKVNLADWMPDGKQILFTASDAKSVRLYLQDLAGGSPKLISADGFHQFSRTISADGKWVAATGPDQKNYLVPITGGTPRLLSNLMAGDQPSGWTADGSSLYVYTRGQIPARVYRLNVQSGEKTLWKELQPYEIAGMYEASRVLPTPDGKTYVASYRQQLSYLFLLDGLR